MQLRLFICIIALLLCTHSYAQQQRTPIKDNSTTTEKLEKQSSLRLYPNPAKTYTNIYIEYSTPQSFTIVIYDMQFKTVLTEIPVGSRKSYQYALDVSKLPDGKYKITVKNSIGEMETLLTVQH